MREYELTFIVHPQVDQEALTGVVEQVQNLVQSAGGSVDKVETWGKRRLAYPIRKAREGQYVFMLLRLDPARVKELERGLKLNEHILRHLVVSTEED